MCASVTAGSACPSGSGGSDWPKSRSKSSSRTRSSPRSSSASLSPRRGRSVAIVCYLARLAMPGMTPAPLAVLAQGDAIRVIALGLLCLVVPALALLACEGHSDPDVSAGHDGVLRESWVRECAGAKENPAPARGRQGRIARWRPRPMSRSATTRGRSTGAPAFAAATHWVGYGWSRGTRRSLRRRSSSARSRSDCRASCISTLPSATRPATPMRTIPAPSGASPPMMIRTMPATRIAAGKPIRKALTSRRSVGRGGLLARDGVLAPAGALGVFDQALEVVRQVRAGDAGGAEQGTGARVVEDHVHVEVREVHGGVVVGVGGAGAGRAGRDDGRALLAERGAGHAHELVDRAGIAARHQVHHA